MAQYWISSSWTQQYGTEYKNLTLYKRTVFVLLFHSSSVSRNIYTNRGMLYAMKYNFTRFNASREIFVEPNRARRPSDIAVSDTKSSITSLLVGVMRCRMAWFPSNGAYKDHPYRYLNVWRLLQCKRTYPIPHLTIQNWGYTSCHVISQT